MRGGVRSKNTFTMLTTAIEIILIAITGYVFTSILINPGMIFDFYGDFLDEKVKPRSHKLADAMGLCVYCFTGQLAFWYYIFTRVVKVDNEPFLIIGFVSASIFIIAILKKKWKI